MNDVIRPSGQSVFVVAKELELLERYEGARMFLRKTERDDYVGMFEKAENERTDAYLLALSRRYAYEAALALYDVVVDLSWTLCYVSTEYASYKQGQNAIDTTGATRSAKAIDLVSTFVDTFLSGVLRSDYNYLKHCGLPRYEEEHEHIGGKGICISKNGNLFASHPEDVGKRVSVHKKAEKLREFDDDAHYPYISELFNELNRRFVPSASLL